MKQELSEFSDKACLILEQLSDQVSSVKNLLQNICKVKFDVEALQHAIRVQADVSSLMIGKNGLQYDEFLGQVHDNLIAVGSKEQKMAEFIQLGIMKSVKVINKKINCVF